MVHTSTTPPISWPDPILCYYQNVTGQLQIARIANVPNCLYEQVVFPGQRLLFEALPDALLDIHACTGSMALLTQIPCLQLRVDQARQSALDRSNPASSD